MSKQPKIAQRYACPGLTDEESQVAGCELRKIAEQQKVNDIRSLTAETVWTIIETDPKHPLRQLRSYRLSQSKAARAHFVEQTRRIISGIRVVTVDIPKRKVHEPMFLSAEAPTKRANSDALRRSHVLREDVLALDPVFMSALGSQIRRIEQALAQAEHLSAARRTPEQIVRLLQSLRVAMSEYAEGNKSAA